MKRVQVIAGGKWQIPLLRKLKEMNYEIVCSNLYVDSPAFEYADHCEVADVRDKEKNLAIAKKYHIDAVLTDQSDIAVPTVAYVAEQLGLKTIGLELAELFTNKYKMREFLIKEGFDCPEFAICDSLAVAKEFFERLNSKAIIKPLDSQSSRGIYEINDVVDLEKHFEETKACSKEQKHVLIERYILGTEFTIDGISINGKHTSLAISEKSHYDFNQNIADALVFTHENANYNYEELKSVNDRIINATKLPFALTHAEYKYENGKFYMIEMAARGGGTKISSDIVPYMTGIDNYGLWIKQALDEPYDIPDFTLSKDMLKRHMVLQFLDCETTGKEIEKIKGIDTIKKKPYIHDFGLNIKVGEILQRASDDSNRIGYYIASGNSIQDLELIKKYVCGMLKICFKKEDMSDEHNYG